MRVGIENKILFQNYKFKLLKLYRNYLRKWKTFQLKRWLQSPAEEIEAMQIRLGHVVAKIYYLQSMYNSSDQSVYFLVNIL